MSGTRSLVARALRAVGLQRIPAQTRSGNAYAGAAINRLTLDWVRAPLSADKELAGDLVQLRARSRDLVRNNPYARRFVRMAQNHIIGPAGVTLQAKNRKPSGSNAGQLDEDLNDHIETQWALWGAPETASASGRLSWLALQRLAIACVAQDGDALFQLRLDPANPFGLSLHPIDADQLDHTVNQRAGGGKPEIRAGVEVDAWGRPVAYYVLRNHPSEWERARDTQRIPAHEIIHLALLEDRVGQTRGAPWFAPVMRDLRMLDGYQEAELVAARLNAAKQGFIVTKDPNGESATPNAGEQPQFSGEPGEYVYLDVNQEVQYSDPNHPNQNFGEFAKAILRATAAGLGASYSSLANDLAGATYSSMKVGRGEEQEQWMALQQWVIETFHRRVFAEWAKAAMLAGALKVPGYDLSRIAALEWRPRRWQSPDPLKDAEAHEKRLVLGLTSRHAIIGAEGGDFEDVLEDLAREEDMAAEAGVSIMPAAPAQPGQTNGQPAAEDGADAPASGDGSGDRAAAGRARRGRRGAADRDLDLVRAAG